MAAKKKKQAVGRRPAPKRKPAKRKAAPKKKAASNKAAKKTAKKRAASGGANRWVKFVEKHGVVLASARGPVPSIAEAVAGEPIVGSWWAHPKGEAIFEALSEIDDSADILVFKLIDGKVTFVHQKAWAALVRLGRDGVIAPEQLGAVQQIHMPTGEHRNIITPFPDWVDDDTSAEADKLSTKQARDALAWAEG